MGPMVDVFFGVRGKDPLLDHGYALYSAIARTLETSEDGWFHRSDQVGLHLVRGLYSGPRRLAPGRRACFGLRLPASLIPKVLPLAGKSLEVGGDRLRVGVPQVAALRPAPVLFARIVTTRNGQEVERFDRRDRPPTPRFGPLCRNHRARSTAALDISRLSQKSISWRIS